MKLPTLKAKGALTAITLMLPLGLIGTVVWEQEARAQQNSPSKLSDSLPDGVYLYSDVPQPDQIQHTYIVFEKEQGKVVGALYTPQSEFACFTGEQEGNQLEVKAVPSEASQSFEATAKLSELHRIDSYSTNDQRILSICKQDATSVN
ncbi:MULTISPECIES: hypothetical protein [Cyanophyceae]|uniref:Uncharacterized protein n=1 Tax=Leptolyngbya subtilissima DQ-A4 TaxID=2933933 RepID=A0ABV0KAF1_9CYAN|nr:hypothetical protein [Nodosilinea sp. FACHB-141]MBD2113720.1 hypothetical protein [Nodosilinea sp. FACHB-141]